jgi:hypothetical protein
MDDQMDKNRFEEEKKIDKMLGVLFFLICVTIGYAVAHFW